jgi:hypothetical protein
MKNLVKKIVVVAMGAILANENIVAESPFSSLPDGITEYTYDTFVNDSFESPQAEMKIKEDCSAMCTKNGKKPAIGRSGKTFDMPSKEKQTAGQAAVVYGQARCYCK